MIGHSLMRYFVFTLLISQGTLNFFGQDLKDYKTDVQGNTYKIYDQEIIKFNTASTTEFRYSNKILGNIYSIDVTSALRPLIFYRDLQKIVITDNTLSKQNQQIISLDEMDIFQAVCVASSKIDNGIWIYDQELLQIIKLDRTLNKVLETGNLQQLLSIDNLSPESMIEKSGYLYVYCPINGFLIFDIYGTYYKTIPIYNVFTWNVIEDKILYVKDGESFIYNMKDFVSESLRTIPPKSNRILWIDPQYLYHCNQKGEVFKTAISLEEK